jgi:hypothetical protein
MTGSALQEDIAATTRALLSEGHDILVRHGCSRSKREAAATRIGVASSRFK